MDPQTKKEIIAEISSTASKTVEQAVRDSLKRALPQADQTDQNLCYS